MAISETIIVNLVDKVSGGLKTIAKGFLAFQGIQAFKQGMEDMIAFEQQLSDVSTLIEGDATRAVDQLRSGIHNMMQEIPVSQEELGASAYTAVSAGFTEMSDSLQVLETSAKLGVAGLGSTESATNLLSVALNSFSYDAADSEAVANILFKTVKNGITNIDALQQSFGVMAGAASSANIPLEDSMAALSALSAISGKTSEEQNKLKNVFSELTQVGGTLDKELAKNGTSLEALNDSIQKNGLVDGMKVLMENSGLTATEFSNLFSSAEASAAVFALLTSAYDGNATALADMKGGMDSLNPAFDKQKEQVGAQYQLLKNELTVAFQEFAVDVIPVLIDGLQLLSDVFDKISEGMGAVTAISDLVVEKLNAQQEGTQKAKEEAAALTEVMAEQTLADMEAERAKKILLEATKDWDNETRKAFLASQNAMIDFAASSEDMSDKYQQKLNEIDKKNKETTANLKKDFDEFKDKATNVMLDVYDGEKTALEGFLELSSGVASEIPVISSLFDDGGESVEDFAGVSADAINSVSGATESLASATSNNTSQISSDWSNTASGIPADLEAASAAIPNVVSQFWTYGLHLVQNFANGITNNSGLVSTAVSGVIAAVNLLKFSTNPLMPTEIYGEHMAQNFADGILKGKKNVDDAILGIVGTVHDFSVSVGDEIVQVNSFIDEYTEKVKDSKPTVAEAFDQTKGVLQEFTDDWKDKMGEVKESLQDMYSDFKEVMAEFEGSQSSSRFGFADAVIETEETIQELQGEISEKQSALAELDMQQQSELLKFQNEMLGALAKARPEENSTYEEREELKLLKAEIKSEWALKQAIFEEEQAAKRDKLENELAATQSALEKESEAYINNKDLINSVSDEILEKKRFNSLTGLEQAVEAFEKEQEENISVFKNKMKMLKSELDENAIQKSELILLDQKKNKFLIDIEGKLSENQNQELKNRFSNTQSYVTAVVKEYQRMYNAVNGISFSQTPQGNFTPIAPQFNPADTGFDYESLIVEFSKTKKSEPQVNLQIDIHGHVTSKDVMEEYANEMVKQLGLSTAIV